MAAAGNEFDRTRDGCDAFRILKQKLDEQRQGGFIVAVTGR